MIWSHSIQGLTTLGLFCSVTQQIYIVETGTPIKKSNNYKYLPYTLQYRSVGITVNHCKSVFTFFHCTWSSN